MKYLFTVLFLFLLHNQAISQILPGASSSQTVKDHQIRFGIKAGISYYNYTYAITELDINETVDSRLGFVVGGYVVIPFSNIFAFQSELMFVQKGGKFSQQSSSDVDLIMNYLDVPLLMRVNIPIESGINPYLVAGPSIGFLFKATRKFGSVSENEDHLNSFNFGFNIGSGATFRQFNIDLRYEFGLSNIYDLEDVDDDFIVNIEGTTSGLMLTVGYTF